MIQPYSSPSFDLTAVQRALERIRQARPLGSNPLRRLVCVQSELRNHHSGSSPIETDIHLADKLMDLIEERLIHHRHVEHLPVQSALERSEALSQMSGDFLSGNAELTAWSLLFYRYVRSDLGLQIKDLAQYLHIDSRQIRRHMQRGYYRLTEAIMHQEVAARATERHL